MTRAVISFSPGVKVILVLRSLVQHQKRVLMPTSPYLWRVQLLMIRKSPKVHNPTLEACVHVPLGEVGASEASSPVTGDKGQSQPPGAGHMTSAEGDKSRNGDHEFGEFVSSESDFQEFEKVNTSSPDNVSSKKDSDLSNKVSGSSNLQNESDLMSFEAEGDSKPVFFSGNESDRINDPSPVPDSSPKGMTIGSIVYLPVSESSQGEVTAKEI